MASGLRKTFRHDVKSLALPPPTDLSHALSQSQCRSLSLTLLTSNRKTPHPPANDRPPRGSPPLHGNIIGESWGEIEATDLARMLPELPDSRGGTSRDATSSNRHSGCGGRRGSRQIRARRPRQERCGREGEQQLPPSGARASAARGEL